MPRTAGYLKDSHRIKPERSLHGFDPTTLHHGRDKCASIAQCAEI
jgi:hypothetical protein